MEEEFAIREKLSALGLEICCLSTSSLVAGLGEALSDMGAFIEVPAALRFLSVPLVGRVIFLLSFFKNSFSVQDP